MEVSCGQIHRGGSEPEGHARCSSVLTSGGETVESNSNIIAAIFSLAGFALAAVSGLIAGNPAADVVLRSIIAMVACRLVGAGAAACVNHVIEEHLRNYVDSRPIPKLPDEKPMEVG